MRNYRAIFSRQAMGFVVEADDEAFAEFARWVDRIERLPGAKGDYTERDDDGRGPQVVVLHRIAVAYWSDHAVCEVRVVQVESV